MKKNGLFFGALVLSVGTILGKIFSAVYRIVLTRILGGVGIGMYQLIFPLYSLAVVIVTAGLPLAVSKLVARFPNNSKKIVKKTLFFMMIVALIVTIFMLLIGKTIRHNNLYNIYYILAPTIVVIASSSILKGYFQGKHQFTPTAISNILEQFVKMVVGIVLSLALIKFGLYWAIVGAMIGIMVSEVVSLVILVICYRGDKSRNRLRVDMSIKELLKDILPITITNIILPIASFIDSIIVVKLLSVNFSNEVSIFLYGLESGAVGSLSSIPTIFSFSLASVLLPNLSGETNDWNKNYKLSLAIKIILIIVVPCVLCFIFIPNRLIEVLYANRLDDLSINGTKIAGALLALSGLGMVALAINQVYSISLQAVNERLVTIRNLIIAVIIKFVLELIFLPTIMLNIYSLAIANTVCYIVVLSLNHIEITRYFNLKINYLFGAKLLSANVLMIVSMIGILAFGNSVINTILAGVVGVIVYLGSLYLMRILSKGDMCVLKYKL